MLVLTLKKTPTVSEFVRLETDNGVNINVRIKSIKGNQVRVAFEMPKSVTAFREKEFKDEKEDNTRTA